MTNPVPTTRALLLLALPVLPISDLGYANGWTETPPVVEKCKHKHDRKKIGRCLTEYSCPICNFKFKVDSGG